MSSSRFHKFLPRPRVPHPDESVWNHAGLVLLVLVGIVALGTFRHYGVTWDETYQLNYGNYILAWYGTGFRDTGALHYSNLALYGGLFDVVAQLLTHVLPFGVFEDRHLVNAGFGIAGLIAASLLGRRMGGPMAGFLSALFLVLTPAFYGHMFFNSKDIPFAATFTWAILAVVAAIPEFPRPSRRTIAKLAIAIGLALGVRIGGVLVFVILAFGFLLWWGIVRPFQAGQPAGWKAALDAPVEFAAKMAWVFWAAVLVMLPWWPAAQVHPFAVPGTAFRTASHFAFPGMVLFDGHEVPAEALPWSYIPKWALVSLPEFLWLALAAGVVLGILVFPRLGVDLARRVRAVQLGTIAFGAVFPVAYAAASGAVLYDALRHFTFVLPLLAVLAAAATVGVVRLAPTPVVVGFTSLMVLGISITAQDMVRLHPYEYVYFNRLFGGPAFDSCRGTWRMEWRRC